ncbi:MAG: hypothetical protein ACYCXY_02385 [Acidimicrobiales bacterium]
MRARMIANSVARSAALPVPDRSRSTAGTLRATATKSTRPTGQDGGEPSTGSVRECIEGSSAVATAALAAEAARLGRRRAEGYAVRRREHRS